jgi:hypothetical protein
MSDVQLTDDEIEAARALCEKATPGPWEHRPQRGHGTLDVIMRHGEPVADVEFVEPGDAAFVCAARTLVPRLIATVDKLRVERPVRPAEEYVCTSCLSTIRNWREMEEYQHDGCGGVVRLRAEIDLNHAISENLAFNIKVATEINEARRQRDALHAEIERMRPIYDLAVKVADCAEDYDTSAVDALICAVDDALAKESTP